MGSKTQLAFRSGTRERTIQVVVRISVVEKDIPGLLSKYIFKTLGANIDIENNQAKFSRLGQVKEPLFELEGGHIASQLLKEGRYTPHKAEEAFKICRRG